jgi:hypothetical protein
MSIKSGNIEACKADSSVPREKANDLEATTRANLREKTTELCTATLVVAKLFVSDVIKAQSTPEAPMSLNGATGSTGGPRCTHFGCRHPCNHPRRPRRPDRPRLDAELGFVVLKVNDVLGTCYDDPEEHSDDSNAILKLLMTILLTAPRPGAPAPVELPTRERASRARVTNTSSALSTLCGPPPLFKTLVEALTPRLVAFDLLRRRRRGPRAVRSVPARAPRGARRRRGARR